MIRVFTESFRRPMLAVRMAPKRLEGKKGSHPAVRDYSRDTKLIPLLDEQARVTGFITQEHLADYQPVRFESGMLVAVEADEPFDAVRGKGE